jgi:hypothetical protein
MEGKLNALAIDDRPDGDRTNYGIITDPSTGCRLIFNVPEKGIYLPVTQQHHHHQLVLSLFTETKNQVTIKFLKAEGG